MNNFHGYLPGGFRRRDYNGNPRTGKIFSDVDGLIDKLNFDAKPCLKKINAGNTIIIDALNSFSSGKISKDELEKLGKRGDAIRDEGSKLLLPLFNAMLDLGYSLQELIA